MILNKNNLVENVLNELSDNSTGQISPYSIRHNLLDIIDSVHLLTGTSNLAALNFATPEIRTTRAGSLTLEKLNLDGYSSVDNSAFGYSALNNNYIGAQNTAIGSFALSCNLYGNDNVGVGFYSLGSNTTGYGNIGIGSFALTNNKIGSGNIAIGHGAGYYATRDTNHKLFIGSHLVNDAYICANPLGVGLIPLIYGDLSDLKLGIGTRSLHQYGALQVAGNIAPTNSSQYDLGHPLYKFSSLYLSDNIVLGSDISIGDNAKIQANMSGVYVSGSIIPSVTLEQNFGSPSAKWLSGHFENIYVSGDAKFNRYTAIETAEYLNKTLYLAVSGLNTQAQPAAYLPDEDLLGAGLVIRSSGLSYQRDYKFTFAPPDESQTCQEINDSYAQAYWDSNISLHLNSGVHFKTARIISHKDLNIVTPSSCYGINLNNDEHLYISRTDILEPNPASSNGHLAGISNVNFLANSGDITNYFINIAAIESGVAVGQRFLTGTKKRVKDSANGNKDKLSGFEIKYIDDSLANVVGSITDRLVIGSYNETSSMKNGLILMKNNADGLLGLNDLSPAVEDSLPKSTFNIRSTGNAVIRVTAENVGNVSSSLQLLGAQNCLSDGCEFQYYSASGFADLSMYNNFVKTPSIRIYENNTVGIFTGSGVSNAMLTIGDSVYTEAVVSLRVASSTPSTTSNYGKLYIASKIKDNQANTVYMKDTNGNIHDLVVNKYDIDDARALYTDSNGNTFGGYQCPQSRTSISSALNNTAIGYQSLYGLTFGDQNTVIGSVAATGLTTGSNNIIVGYNAAPLLTTSTNNIIIGNNGVANTLSSTHNFIVGASNTNILLQGKSGPTNTDKYLEMPSGGKFTINTTSNLQGVVLQPNFIDVVDRVTTNRYPSNSLIFRFAASGSAPLLTLSHNVYDPMTNSAVYASPSPVRPFAQLEGDIKLRGAIRFSDTTSLSSSSFLNDISTLQTQSTTASNAISSLTNRLNGLVVEGIASQDIAAPSSPNLPTSGSFSLKNEDWSNTTSVMLYNRDPSSQIKSGAYVVAIYVNGQYRPLWVSADTCDCCPT